MAVGDQNDMYERAVDDLVPWFGYISNETTNIIYSFLQGMALTDSAIYDDIKYVDLQTRIRTATGINLDYIALDFFGPNLIRHAHENDTSFRARIFANIFQEKATRYGMINVLTKLTGRVPVVIEGQYPGDIGGYDETLFYDESGGMGWIEAYTAIIFVFRPQPTGIMDRGGYDIFDNKPGFGYDFHGVTPSNSYIDLSEEILDVTDDDIINAIENTKVYGTHIYTFILD